MIVIGAIAAIVGAVMKSKLVTVTGTAIALIGLAMYVSQAA